MSHSNTELEKLDKSQSDQFKDVARAAECDEDEARWQERLRQIAKQKLKDEWEKAK